MLDQDPNAPRRQGVQARYPRASAQRQRAAGLRAVAVEIDSTVIAQLDRLAATANATLADTGRGRLCLAMLDRHLHQLHAIVEELRELAFRCTADADQIDCPGRHATRR